jgi:FHA domain
VLGQSITPFALSALKYGLLALLFLFIWRSMRWAVRGLAVQPPGRAAGRGAKGKAREDQPEMPPGPSSVVVYADGAKPRTVPLHASTVVGRAPECDLLIEDTYASQQHARIFGKGGSWYVEDLGSTNGTFVNDQKLAAPAMVQPGDRIRLGTTVLELRR